MNEKNERLEKLKVSLALGAQSGGAQVVGAQVKENTNPYGTASTKGQALELLSKGMGTLAVAQVLNISAGAVSQFLAEPEFKERVGAALQAKAIGKIKRDEVIDELEDKAWKQLGDVLPFMTKPMEIIRVAQVLNSANRRAAESGIGTGVTDADSAGVVTLRLPVGVVSASVGIKLNTNNEVVEVDGRELRTMQASTLVGIRESRAQARALGTAVSSAPSSAFSGEATEEVEEND